MAMPISNEGMTSCKPGPEQHLGRYATQSTETRGSTATRSPEGVGNWGIGSYEGALTAEGLLMYLSMRLNSIDNQIDAIFLKQQKNEAIRKSIAAIQNELAKLSENPANPGELLTAPTDYEYTVFQQLDELAKLDPGLAQTLRQKMSEEGQILWGVDRKYFGNELTASKQLLDTVMKDLESCAQMDMIRLQSMMSARQTAIQLSTNLVSALGESLKATVSNIGR